MSPSDRGEMLTKAEDFIKAHKEIAVEGQTAVNILLLVVNSFKDYFKPLYNIITKMYMIIY